MKGKQSEVAHRDNELGHPQSLRQLRMLPRLTTTLKAGLKLRLQKRQDSLELKRHQKRGEKAPEP